MPNLACSQRIDTICVFCIIAEKDLGFSVVGGKEKHAALSIERVFEVSSPHRFFKASYSKDFFLSKQNKERQ